MLLEPVFYHNVFNAHMELVSSIVSTIGFAIMIVISGLKYQKKKTPASMHLFLMMISFFSAFLCRAISLLGWFVAHDHKNNVYRYAMQFSYVSLQLASIFLILFSNEIFSIVKGVKKGRMILIIYAIISMILIVLLLDIPGNNIGEYDGTTDTPLRRIITQGVILGSSLVLFLFMIYRFFKLSRKVDNYIHKRAMLSIWLSYLFQLLSLVFVTIDGLISLVYNEPTFFLVLMHVGSLVSAYFMYKGLFFNKTENKKEVREELNIPIES